MSACGNTGETPVKPVARPLTPQALDKALHDQVKTVVVIYAENRSFNNLFADFPGVEKPLSALSAADTQQRDRDGSLLTTLPPAWGGVLHVGPSALTPDGYAVNTLAPPYWPTWIRDPQNPDYSKPDLPNVLVPQTHEHIGDKLSKKNVDWAWYAGAWQATLEQLKDSGGIPKTPNFQYHHQPFNYFKQQGPENRAEREKRLRDGGLGDESSTNKFFADAQPAVSFYKPQGNLNMHAGYADVASGDRHIARALKVLQESPQWKNMVVVVTVDENGGWWDHVAPPQGDRWGPGTRIPALVVSPFARKGTVDHTVYDTASILRLITRVFELEKLDGLKQRDDAMIARGQQPMGDLSNALQFDV